MSKTDSLVKKKKKKIFLLLVQIEVLQLTVDCVLDMTMAARIAAVVFRESKPWKQMRAAFSKLLWLIHTKKTHEVQMEFETSKIRKSKIVRNFSTFFFFFLVLDPQDALTLFLFVVL